MSKTNHSYYCPEQHYSSYANLILECSLLSVDVIQLEQDTVMGVESLMVLCSQDDSATAQTTLKVCGSLHLFYSTNIHQRSFVLRRAE